MPRKSAFSTAFKRVTGNSPRGYRSAMRRPFEAAMVRDLAGGGGV
jgi:AraC-like DNA-binding protein